MALLPNLQTISPNGFRWIPDNKSAQRCMKTECNELPWRFNVGCILDMAIKILLWTEMPPSPLTIS